MESCGLTSLPDRRTFDRRLSTISADIKERIATMASLFVKEKLVDPYIIAIDSTLLRAKGHLWHKSSMIKGLVPRSGIDTDARWGFSHTKHWMFGYKLHITSSTGSLIIPLSADFTQADVQPPSWFSDSMFRLIHFPVAYSRNPTTPRGGFALWSYFSWLPPIPSIILCNSGLLSNNRSKRIGLRLYQFDTY